MIIADDPSIGKALAESDVHFPIGNPRFLSVTRATIPCLFPT
jgi:hypothetical protein